jgi:spore germination protein KB
VRRGRLSVRQLFWCTILLMFPTIILFLPGDLLRTGGRSAWWTPLVVAPPALGLLWATGALARRFGSPIRAARDAFGPVAMRLVAGLLWAVLALYTVVVVREFAQGAAITYVFEDVPVAVLTAMGLVPAASAAWLGLVVVGRTAEAVLPVLLVVYLGLLLALLPFSHPVWALPLRPEQASFVSLQPLARTGVWLVEPALVTLAADELGQQGLARLPAVLAGAAAAIAVLLALTVWLMVADFGPIRAAQLTLPIYEAAREATFGAFLEHMEALFIPVVLLGGTGKMALFYWLWTRTGRELTGGGAGVWLAGELVAGGAASVLFFRSAVQLDLALYTVLARFAVPALVGGILLAYTGAAWRARRSGP